MDRLKDIRLLLEKFYEGETSSQEEEELRTFFLNNQVPEDLQEERNMFVSFPDIEKPVEVPEGLNEGIIERLEEAVRKERRSRRVNLYSLSGMAAGLLIMFSVYIGFLEDRQTNDLAQYAIEDPEIAYQEAKRAIQFVSMKMNIGTEELKSLDYVNKGMKTLQPLRKMSSGSKELQLIGNVEKANQIHRQ